MTDLTHTLRSVRDARVFGLVLVALALCGGVLFVVLTSPLHGFVSATVFDADGTTHAVTIDVTDLTTARAQFAADEKALLIAAVPSPATGKSAFVTRTKGGAMHVSVGDMLGKRVVEIADGSVTTPTWSQDGASIAVAAHDSEATTTLNDPSAWTVLRAVTHGDSLTVGHGYHPFPSQNQRTFALTAGGIVLLSYNDLPPTIIVASPKPVPLSTPFTVSLDGSRVAWVAPADHSLQVFENVNGYFVPLLLKKDSTLQSLVFSPDGAYLLGASQNEATSTLSLVRVKDGVSTNVGDIGGFVKLNTWLYEN